MSFTSASLDLLERMDFWVCEKSDGVRVLVFIVINGATGRQEVWLVCWIRLYVRMDAYDRSIESRGTTWWRICISHIGNVKKTHWKIPF